MADSVDVKDATKTIHRDAMFKLRSRKLHIEIIDGPDAGNVVVLPGPEVRIGGGSECDLTLSDPTVSRHHVTLHVDKDGVRVIDARSRNGTTVDGLRVYDALARPDSQIVIGRTTLRLRLLSDVVELPLSDRDRFGALLGQSPAMRHLFAVLERVAPTETTVLIEAETGTGKELIAEAIHEESARSSGPFVVFDCSSVSAQLIESELFGHKRGAFTGAVADRVGAFEAADGGTLFLDEIGELPLDLQPKLLRALERLQVRPVGTHEAREVDVRIVAATNRSLAREVEKGSFREDLYYRLAVVRVTVPPLRERAEDIPMLVEHFSKQFVSRSAVDSPIPPRMIRAWQTMAWPGNVRELRNAVARALSIGTPRDLRASSEIAIDVAAATAPAVDLSIPLKTARDQVADAFERAYVAEALREAGGNVTRAAEIAGVNRKFIHRAIQKYDLRSDD